MAIVLNLPAGTDVTKQFNLPTCGGWVGAMTLSFTTTTTDATIHEWLIMYPNHADGKIRVRRTGGTTGNNFSNWTLGKNQRYARGLYKGETMTTVNYTSANDLSLCVETTRMLTPTDYPPIPASSGSANEIAIAGNPVGGKVYWLAS